MNDKNINIIYNSLITLNKAIELLPNTDIVDEIISQLSYITSSVYALKIRNQYSEDIIDETFEGLDLISEMLLQRISSYKKSLERKTYRCT